MPSRLPVVIAQFPLRAGRESELEESLVSELIFANGLDATLVQSLDRIDPGGTDHLCLESITVDFALLTWLPIPDVCANLDRLSVSGQVVQREREFLLSPIPLSRASRRRIHVFGLAFGMAPPSIMNQLRQIHEGLNTKTISLMSKREIQAPLSPPKDPPVSLPVLAKPPASDILSTPKSSTVPSDLNHDDREDEWSHLDKLVDDLDAIME